MRVAGCEQSPRCRCVQVPDVGHVCWAQQVTGSSVSVRSSALHELSQDVLEAKAYSKNRAFNSKDQL